MATPTTISAPTFNAPMDELKPALTGRVLVVEGDIALQKVLQRLFCSKGYEVDVAPDGSAGLEILRRRLPSALILDLRPGSASCDLCREIVRLAPGLPFIILSANSNVVDKVRLLELGAADYVTIPFSPRELVARLGAQMRRAQHISIDTTYVFRDVIVDFSKTETTRRGQTVSLTATEFKTLTFLTKNAQRVISRDELLREVWGYENYPCTRTVDTHILRLRQKLESDPSHPSHFLTVHRMGYKFVP